MEHFFKRKTNDNANTDTISKKPKKENCPHASNCFRKNPHHFKEYDHPHLNEFIAMGDKLVIPEGLPQPKTLYQEQIALIKSMTKTESNQTASCSIADQSNNKSVLHCPSTTTTSKTELPKSNLKCEPGTMLDKLQKCAPYNYFFTTIPKSPSTLTQTNSIRFVDLLCPSLGTLKTSLQINFMIDISWLLEQYEVRNLHKKPLTILCADEFPKMDEYIRRLCPHVTHHFVKMKDPFGCHHSKVGIYRYEDNSLRVVVSTANLYYEDWNHYNQGLWLSPACPQLPESAPDSDGESPTGFKVSLLNYLKHYNLDILKDWLNYVKRADFSAVRVFLVTSVPGKHYPQQTGSHLLRVGDLLGRHCNLPKKTTPESEGPLAWGIIAQASSLGSMGKTPADWLRGSLLRSLASHSRSPLPASSNATLNLVYPTVDNVMTAYFGAESGGCLPYSKATNEKQRWLQSYLHQWKADTLNRTRAMPHHKSYCRISPCLSKLAYFLLTSANISKSAWGGNIQKDKSVYVRSYEVGVLFLPKFFDEEYFEIRRTTNMKNKNVFPFMYDLPLVPYKSNDYPWCN